jgi:hypothetical protein
VWIFFFAFDFLTTRLAGFLTTRFVGFLTCGLDFSFGLTTGFSTMIGFSMTTGFGLTILVSFFTLGVSSDFQNFMLIKPAMDAKYMSIAMVMKNRIPTMIFCLVVISFPL